MTNKEYILSTLKSKRVDFSAIGIREVGLFGSYVRDEQTEKSDIDILIDFDPEKETFDNYMAVYELLEKLFKNIRVEVVTKNGLSPYIGPKILNEVQYV
ncbi:MAG TPA: DNA polymerase subunit beta [Mariniphaga anaerophila]|uniref:DNA polymerase subunit beta n=1 Tax=Mariniphaga anaerophila TaxID=1484053 RepID=A0A831PRY3_9BACT|nr:DNA polymerase subunit beta [Mariniphaga anaerophila]